MEIKDLKTKKIGKKFQSLETVTSTQEYIKQQDSFGKIQDGEVVCAERQTAGIGTHEKKWYTGKGKNLAFSFALFPNCNLKNLENLTVIIAESFIEAVRQLYLIKLQIKEPNDIIYKDKKMGGILTESVTEGETVKKIYIGIGFNVNEDEFPGNLSDIATSLKKEFKTDFPREDILVKFLEVFEKRYLELIER